MGIKHGLNEVFNGYVSNLNLKKDFTQHDSYVLDKIGYLKQVLSGERRKKEQGSFWTWESRIKEAQRVIHNINLHNKEKYPLSEEEVDVLNGMFDLTFKNKYFVKKFETASKDSDLCIISKNIASTINNYFDIYSKIKYGGNIRIETIHKDNLETIASATQERSLAGVGRGKTKLATIALLATLGLGIVTGIGIKGCYDSRILREKDKKIEQIVQESKKPRMMILTDLPSDELDKRYEKYAQEEKAGRIPILDLRYSVKSNKDSIEYYLNKECNKGTFVRGFMYSTNKMQVPPEFDEQELKERAELKKRWANIDEKVRKEQKRFEQGINDFVTFRHPVKGLWKTFTGFFGQMNGVARGFARPIAYFLTRNDRIDRAIDDFGDASYFGDSYDELHENIFGLKFQKTRDFIKKHPVKSTISIAEDVFLWKLLHGHGDEGGAAAGAGGGTSSSPGWGGGAGTP